MILFPMFIDSSKGGMQSIVVDLINSLNKIGIPCLMIVTSTSDLITTCEVNNIDYLVIKKNTKGALSIIETALRFLRITAKYKKSLFIVNDIFTHILLSLYPLKKKEVFVSHGGDYKSKGKEHASNSGMAAKIAKLYSFKRVDKFVAVSETQKKNLVNNASVPEGKVTVIPNGVNQISRTHNDGNNCRISIVGYIKPLKNQETIIKAIRILKDRGYAIHLNIYGSVADQVYYQKLLQIISSLGICEDVTFYGYVDDKNSVFNNTDILVSCSHHEGFGLSIVEAMSCYVPTIAFKGAEGPATIITNNKTGILVEHNNEIEFANGIENYIARPDFRIEITNEAYNDYVTNYNMEVMCQRYCAIISQFNNLR